jgi:hypothetical protein
MPAKFQLGQTVATPAALALLTRLGLSPTPYIDRHVSGDWGDLDAEDKEANDLALTVGNEQRILSSYNLTKTDKIWIISEWDRSVTTVLLPSDY